MNARCSFRLLAVLLSLLPGVRALAQTPRGAESINFRVLTLDLLHKEATEASEREEARAARLAAVKPSPLSAVNFDVNKDGKLDDKEFATWTAALRKFAVTSPEAMKRFDTDKDGKLSDPEWNAAVDQLFGAR